MASAKAAATQPKSDLALNSAFFESESEVGGNSSVGAGSERGGAGAAKGARETRPEPVMEDDEEPEADELSESNYGAHKSGHADEHSAYGTTMDDGPHANEYASARGGGGHEYADDYDTQRGAQSERTFYDDATEQPSVYRDDYETYSAPSTGTPGGHPLGRGASDATYSEYNEKPRRRAHIETPRTAYEDAGGDDEEAESDYYYNPKYQSPREEDPESFPVIYHHTVGEFGEFGPFMRLYVELRQLVMFVISSVSLGAVIPIAYAWYFNPFRSKPPKARADIEFDERITGERLSERPQYYAEFWGYKCEEYEIITKGGWILKAHRISDPRRPGGRGYPVVLQHGILCNSLFWLTNEERSLAFWLVDRGYDVWSTNIRANFNAGHVRYSRSDPRFWAWALRELADDLVDVVDYILETTGYRQLAYVGHSQGTGSMFIALSQGIHPELGYKLSSFTALGPSVFAGEALRRFPFSLMHAVGSTRYLWSLAFGVRKFLPIIDIARLFLPAYWFGHLGYLVFGYAFRFNDHNWVNRQKPKIFRATGVGTSSELLYYYLTSFAYRGCSFDPHLQTPWFPKSFPPLTVVFGTTDTLVLGKPLVERLMSHERNVEIVHIVELQGYEHMDMVIGVDAYKTVFPKIHDTIQRTLDPEDVPAHEDAY